MCVCFFVLFIVYRNYETEYRNYDTESLRKKFENKKCDRKRS